VINWRALPCDQLEGFVKRNEVLVLKNFALDVMVEFQGMSIFNRSKKTFDQNDVKELAELINGWSNASVFFVRFPKYLWSFMRKKKDAHIVAVNKINKYVDVIIKEKREEYSKATVEERKNSKDFIFTLLKTLDGLEAPADAESTNEEKDEISDGEMRAVVREVL
jgi:hypothetical protein